MENNKTDNIDNKEVVKKGTTKEPPRERNEKTLREEFEKDRGIIEWESLSKFFASGLVILLSDDMDIVEVAVSIGLDKSEQVAEWMDKNRLQKISDDKARKLYDEKAFIEALVVAPWVLVKEIPEKFGKQKKNKKHEKS